MTSTPSLQHHPFNTPSKNHPCSIVVPLPYPHSSPSQHMKPHPPSAPYAPYYWHPMHAQPQGAPGQPPTLTSPNLPPVPLSQPTHNGYPIVMTSHPHPQAQPQPHPYQQQPATPPLHGPHPHATPVNPASIPVNSHLTPFNPSQFSALPSASAATQPRPRKPYTTTKVREMWSPSEHSRMLEALQLYKRDWAKVTRHVGSRSAAQVRSHAQKYFDRVARENSGEFVPQPRPKRKSATPYPRKPRDSARNVLDSPHEQAFTQHNSQHHTMPVPVSLPVRMSPITTNPYSSSNPMVNSQVMQSPAVSPVMHQIPPSYTAGSGVAMSTPMAAAQLGYVNAPPNATPSTPMTPLTSCGAQMSGNIGIISPITPYPSALLPSPQTMPSQVLTNPGHMPMAVQMPMGMPIAMPTSMSRTPQPTHLFTSPINQHEQVQPVVQHGAQMMAPPMMMTASGATVALAHVPASIALSTSGGLTPSMMPMTAIPSDAHAAMANNMVPAPNAFIPHAHPNNDARNCSKCQALQRFGGVLNEIRASTARRAAAGNEPDGGIKSGDDARQPKCLNDGEQRATVSPRSGDAKDTDKKKSRVGARVAKLSVSSKGVSKPAPISCSTGVTQAKSKPKTKRGEIKRAVLVEDESDSASMHCSSKENIGAESDEPLIDASKVENSKSQSQFASPPAPVAPSPAQSQARSVSATQSDGTDGDEGAEVDGSASRSRSGDDLATNLSNEKFIKKRSVAQKESSAQVKGYSQRERREIYDAVQSLQILAKRSSSPKTSCC